MDLSGDDDVEPVEEPGDEVSAEDEMWVNEDAPDVDTTPRKAKKVPRKAGGSRKKLKRKSSSCGTPKMGKDNNVFT